MQLNYILLVLFALSRIQDVLGRDDDFAFDLADDFEVEFEDQPVILQHPDRKSPGIHLKASVGRVFHYAAPRHGALVSSARNFEAKKHGGKGLPSWLLFDRKTGVFWGIPLSNDIGIQHLTVTLTSEKKSKHEISVEVTESTTSSERCSKDESLTVLTLVLDKNIEAIKPKQRIIAVNNLAKFFGVPYSAFSLSPQTQKDDITDSNIVLAGPGNVRIRSADSSSLLEVPVGCDGRLWLSKTRLVHQLKKQARDGTISEVIRLPLIGWRVKSQVKPVVRSKRETINDYGSGDYGDDDYYEDYEDDYEVSGDPPPAKNKPVVAAPPVTSTTSTTTTTEVAPEIHHPHRHHHGEVKNTEEDEEIEDDIPSVSVVHDTQLPETTPLSTTTTSTTTVSTTTASKTSSESPTITTTSKSNNNNTNNRKTTSNEKKAVLDPGGDALEDDDYDYDANYDDDDDDIESETIVPVTVDKKVPEMSSTTTSTTEAVTAVVPNIIIDEEEQSTTVLPSSTTTTTTAIPIAFTTLPTTPVTNSTTTVLGSTSTTEATTFEIIEETEPPIVFTIETTTQGHTDLITTTVTPSTSTVGSTITVGSTTVTMSVTALNTTTLSTSTTPISTESTLIDNTTPFKSTTATRQVSTTPSPVNTTIISRDTTQYVPERVAPPASKNYPPYIENRLQYMSVIAGKVFRFVIPENSFKDAEDGYNLTIQVLDINEQPITNSSWLQFNPVRRELYGLPLEEDVSKWVYNIRAIDRDGEYDQDQLTIQVHQHKLARVVNHEFSLQIRIEKRQEFHHNIDWALRVLRALGKIYNTNMSEITVRHIDGQSEPAIFSWSNDSIATSFCPKDELQEIYKILTANDRGDPSRDLSITLAPELRVKKVLQRQIGVCEPQTQTPITPPVNLAPIIRNPVDRVQATVGEILVYKVSEDTFYDTEDGNLALNLTLLTGERRPLPPANWLQFDSKNREFFGVPFKAERVEYQLVGTDSGGLSASDSLEVVVNAAPKKHYNVEFSMTIEVPYESFSNNAYQQRKLIEKLVELFEESSTENFQFVPFKKKQDSTMDSTVVAWYNKSLAVEKCPHDEIKRLETLLHNNDQSIDSRVHHLMGNEFRVSTFKVHLIGNCKKAKAPVLPPVEDVPPAQKSENDYMMTFIVPAVIVGVMLLLAGIAACVLYRRRRSGKMNVEEDGRQTYGNKGIPVIFQEELEEKPEPGTKAPVILKDEKPPLAPPEYSKSGSVKLDDSEPYQPPPPFTRNQDNGRQPRPKATPTYRKPPPYVPP